MIKTQNRILTNGLRQTGRTQRLIDEVLEKAEKQSDYTHYLVTANNSDALEIQLRIGKQMGEKPFANVVCVSANDFITKINSLLKAVHTVHYLPTLADNLEFCIMQRITINFDHGFVERFFRGILDIFEKDVTCVNLNPL